MNKPTTEDYDLAQGIMILVERYREIEDNPDPRRIVSTPQKDAAEMIANDFARRYKTLNAERDSLEAERDSYKLELVKLGHIK